MNLATVTVTPSRDLATVIATVTVALPAPFTEKRCVAQAKAAAITSGLRPAKGEILTVSAPGYSLRFTPSDFKTGA